MCSAVDCKKGWIWPTFLFLFPYPSSLSLSLPISPSPPLSLSLSGKDRWGFGYGGTGKKSCSGQFDDYGVVSLPTGFLAFVWEESSFSFLLCIPFLIHRQPFGKDDVIGCFLDLDAGSVSYSKNGKQHRWFLRGYPSFHIKLPLQANFWERPLIFPRTW